MLNPFAISIKLSLKLHSAWWSWHLVEQVAFYILYCTVPHATHMALLSCLCRDVPHGHFTFSKLNLTMAPELNCPIKFVFLVPWVVWTIFIWLLYTLDTVSLIDVFGWAKVAYVLLTFNTVFFGLDVWKTRLIVGLTLNNFTTQSRKYSPHINISFFLNAYSFLRKNRNSIHYFISNPNWSL